MRSHRIWNEVHADNYTAGKSFGGEFRQLIAVGSSASYSNPFAAIEVREVALDSSMPDWSLFILYMDGEQMKRAAFNNKTKEYKPMGVSENAYEIIGEYPSAA